MEENTSYGSQMEKDEYYGRWIRCWNCDYVDNVIGARYCGGCGKRLLLVDGEFKKDKEGNYGYELQTDNGD